MTPRPEEEAYGGAEVPRGMDTADMILLIQRAVREMQPPQPKLVYQHNGKGQVWIGIAATAAMALSAWTLYTVSDLKTDVAVLKCQLSPECRKPALPQPLERGAP